jgi:hypothetical protein
MSTPRDLALDANGDLLIIGQDLAPLVADDAAILSDVEATIRFVLGEWFADTSQGIPWFQVLGVKNPPLNALRSALFTQIGARRGITQVIEVTITQKKAARSASVVWSAQSDAGVLGSTVQVSP